MPVGTPSFQQSINFLADVIAQWGLRLAAALAILLVTHIVAKLSERAIVRLGKRFVWTAGSGAPESNDMIGSQAGKLGYWLIWLFGFVIALQPLELGGVITPINVLLSEIGVFLPRLIGAIALLIVGLALSRIARGIVTNSVGMVPIDRLLSVGEANLADRTRRRVSLAAAAGTTVQILVLLPIALAAVDVLGIEAVAHPVRELLATILLAVPRVIAAALVLVIALVVARWIASATETLLSGLGVDDAGQLIGLGEKVSLSRVSYHLVLIAIMLFAFAEAARLLDFAVTSRVADEVIEFGGRIVFGAAFIAAAFFVARILAKVVSGNGHDGMARLAFYAVTVTGVAMGLSFMGVATQIVTIAFGAFIAAGAVAFAISFGLAGRQTAHELLEKWTSKANDDLPKADD